MNLFYNQIHSKINNEIYGVKNCNLTQNEIQI